MIQYLSNECVKQAVQNLRRLNELIPDAPNPQDLSVFGEFFAAQLACKNNPTPLIVYNVLSGSLWDIVRNWDNTTRKHVNLAIAGKPAEFYTWYFENMPRIIQAVFSPEEVTAINELWRMAYERTKVA